MAQKFLLLSAYRCRPFLIPNSRWIGRVVARQVFDRFGGKWQVTQEEGNLPAQVFWQRVIEERYFRLNGI